MLNYSALVDSEGVGGRKLFKVRLTIPNPVLHTHSQNFKILEYGKTKIALQS